MKGMFSRRTESRKLAAAIAPLGCPIKVEVIENAATGEVNAAYHIHLGEGGSITSHEITRIIGRMGDGSLEKEEPHHPVLDAMRGILNCTFLRRWRDRGESVHLMERDGRYVYAPGAHEIPSCVSGGWIKTRDDFMAAALGVMGFPAIKHDGKCWWFREFGFRPIHGVCQDYIDGFREQKIATEDEVFNHPLHWAYHGARVADALLDRVENDVRLISIKKLNSNTATSAVVRSDITGQGMDRVGEFFGA
jgi:hypothetical protein